MTLSLEQWHQRYQQQARWTQTLRKYIYDRVGMQIANKVLDVGCGTGVLLSELDQVSSCSMFGLDINFNALSRALQLVPKSLGAQGDGVNLPYSSESFDLSLCHFLLLWVKDPLQVLKEMSRVTRPNGYVLALAEPDYGGRIDFPEELSQVGRWQIESLREQGANPLIGRKLRSFFSNAGLKNIEVGVLGAQWREEFSAEDFELEWKVVKSDLHRKNEFIDVADELKALDFVSRKDRHRILYVPTFYAFGEVDR